MNKLNSKEYSGFSHARYLENDPVQYDIEADEVTIRENQEAHFHDDVELLFIIEGEAKLYVNSEESQISSGDLIMFMPYHVHAIRLLGDNIKTYHCRVSLGLLLFSSISRVIEKHVAISIAYGNNIVKFTEKEKEYINDCFVEIIDEINSDKIIKTMIALSTVVKIILLFSRKIAENITDSLGADHGIAWKLMCYINSNFSHSITSKSLADEFSLTPIKVNNHFYSLTGENLSENLHRVRIRHACSMLQFDQLSSSYIGKYVGYKTTPSFFRKFKELKNMTPDEYRKTHLPDDSIYRSLNLSWKIVLYLYNHYSEPINEESVAKALYLSPEVIRTELYSNFDVSLNDLLTQIRIQFARSFLQVLNTPILHIAYLSGFSSVRTFNRCFKKEVGCTPMEFREMMKKKITNVL